MTTFMHKTNAKGKAIRAAFGSMLIAGTALAGVPAFAQQVSDSADDDEGASTAGTRQNVIIVTAQRREENILDVPYNISVISGEQIEGAVTLDNAELLRNIPGASQIDQGPRSAAQFNSVRIRGLNVDDSGLGDFAVASVATVSTYVNETPVFANLALVDISRVEVLRGPQGTLYGSGALGGTIKYFLNEPELGAFEGRVSGSGTSVRGSGSLGYTTSAVVNVPLGDTAAFRVNVARQDFPGITDYVNLYELGADGVPSQPNGLFDRGFDSATYTSREDVDDYDSWYLRASFKFEPSDSFSLVANYIYQDDFAGGRRQKTQGANGVGVPYEGFQSGSVIEEPYERDLHLGSLEASVDFGFATLTSATSYYENEGSSETDNTGFYANNFAFYYYNYPRPLYTADRTFGDKAFVQELRLVSNDPGPIEYVVGAFYREQTTRSSQISDLVGFEAWIDAAFFPADFVSTDNIFTYRRQSDYTDMAVFGELTWNVTDAFHLTGGLRYFDNDTDVDTFVRTGAYDSIAGQVSTPFKSSDDGFLYKINAALNFGDDDLAYATMSRGYRRGGNNGVPTIGRFANDPSFQIYTPDTVINYEAGIKGTVGDVRYDVSVFYIDWDNPQFNTSAPVGSFFAVVNGDEARTMGFEAQISGYIGDQITYSLGYAYVDAELTEDLLEPINILTGARNVIATAGAPLPGIPKHAINVAADYTQPVSNDLDFIFRMDGFYQSSTQNVLNQGVLDAATFSGFSIWDLTASLVADNWTVSLFAKNIFDEEGTTGAFTEAAFGSVPAAEFFGSNSRQFVALPRTVGIAATFDF